MKRKVVNVVGVHQRLQGYPNVLYLLDELERSDTFDYNNYNVPMWSGSLSSNKSIYFKAKNIFKAFCAHVKIIRHFIRNPDLDCVYVPYPSIFVAFSLSLIPKKSKPNFLIIDAFISVYDTVIMDRGLYSKTGILAKCLKKIEKVAFEQADVVITDTHQNSKYYSQLFSLPLSKFKDVPLATDEESFGPGASSVPRKNTQFNVIFIGTLIPLHGIETILKASQILADNRDILFTIVGDGQMSHLVEKEIESGAKNIQWIRQWQSSKQLVSRISQADIGLGVFGKGDKTQRVCPFKLYLYFACGLPVITGKTDWSMRASRATDCAPFLTVSVGSSGELASSILMCYQTERLCVELSSNGRKFYDASLANRIAREKIEHIFTCRTA